MKKQKYAKLIIIAAGIILSAAFYMYSGSAEPLAPLEKMETEYEDRQKPDTEADETGVETNAAAGDILLGFTDEMRRELSELVRIAVREELTAICEEGYLQSALEKTAAQAAENAEARRGLVNINLASREELMKLDGIGQKRAEDIIRYREQYGDFQKPEDVMHVSGIKQAAYEKIKDKICV